MNEALQSHRMRKSFFKIHDHVFIIIMLTMVKQPIILTSCLRMQVIFYR